MIDRDGTYQRGPAIVTWTSASYEDPTAVVSCVCGYSSTVRTEDLQVPPGFARVEPFHLTAAAKRRGISHARRCGTPLI